MKTIVVAIDFSKTSKNAAMYAAGIAVAVKAKILLVHIIQIPVAISEIPVSEYQYDAMMEDADKEMENLKLDLTLSTQHRVQIDTKVSFGSVAHQLSEVCESHTVFFMVLGSDTRLGFEKYVLGNNVLETIRTAKVPIVVVPGGAEFTSMSKMTLAADLTRVKEIDTLLFLDQLVKLFHAHLKIITVVKDEKTKQELLPASEELHQKLLEINAKFQFVIDSKVEDGIDKFLQNDKADLLIILKGEHGPFHRSITKRIISHPYLPILILP